MYPLEDVVEQLKPREFQILREYAILGNANAVASKLDLSFKTVHHYLSIVKSRLDCKTAFKVVSISFDDLGITQKDLQNIPIIYVTVSQKKVLDLLVLGMQNKQIANICGIQHKSVNIYVNKILTLSYGKLNNRIQLFTYKRVFPDLFTLKPVKPTLRDMVLELVSKGKTIDQIVSELNCSTKYASLLLRSVGYESQEIRR